MPSPLPTTAHHYIPQFHLREFGTETFSVPGVTGRFGRRPGLIWQFDKSTGEYARVPIKKAVQRPNYYTVPGAGDDLEDAFEQLERNAARAVRRMHDLAPGQHDLSPSDRLALTLYAALLNARAPSTRDPTVALASFAAGTFLDMQLSSADRFRDRARNRGDKRSNSEIEAERITMLEELRRGDLRVAAREEHGLMGLKPAVEAISPMLWGMSWFLLRTAPGQRLVLGDQPVTFIPPDDHRLGDAVGPGTPGAIVSLPLSPTALLTMSRTSPDAPAFAVLDDPPSHFELPAAAEANISTWRWAQRFIYGHSRADLEAAALLLKPVSRLAVPQLYVFGLPDPWFAYLPHGIVAGYDAAQPENLLRISSLPGDVDVPRQAPPEAEPTGPKREREP